ncbi:DUF3299 domain-containing protein [Aquimonas sp.]|jgi:hypothetical protein|uniref:DUF3299 domain-containing protein n=1 Tax=Aquimonas sp. TaxID=1872588 RepID=UPI0037C0478E
MTRVLCALVLSLLIAPAFAEDRTFDWLELIPEEELKALQDAPVVDHAGEPVAPDYTDSQPVLALNGAEGKLPGYIVPVTITEDNKISEFFVVPYFGACIHVPPPPPNQIVFAKPDEPIEMTEIWAAYWVYGKIEVKPTRNSVAQSYYTIDVQKVEPWE